MPLLSNMAAKIMLFCKDRFGLTPCLPANARCELILVVYTFILDVINEILELH